jgi:hypothetical protein
MRYYSIFLMSVTLASCSSWKQDSKRFIASEGGIFGEWKLTAAKESCPDKLSIARFADRTAIEIKDGEGDGWVLPLKAGDIRNSYDKICGATQIDGAGVLTRDCAGNFTFGSNSIPVKMNWKIVPIGANNIDYTFINVGVKALGCNYERLGAAAEPTQVSISLRQEPPLPQLKQGERVVYKEIGREVYGTHKIGKTTVDLDVVNNRDEQVNIVTVAAPMKVTIERSITPCSVIIMNGQGDDPNRCQSAIFDRAEGGETYTKELSVEKGSFQDESVALKGKLNLTLDVDGKLKYEIKEATDNVYVGVYESGDSIGIRFDKPSKAALELSKSIKVLSVSKGILTVESDVADLAGYKINFKVVRNPTIGFSKTLINEVYEIGGDYVSQTLKNNKAILKMDLRKAIEAAGDEYKSGKKHDFEVTAEVREVTSGPNMHYYTIIQKPKGLSTAPVMKGIYKIKAD